MESAIPKAKGFGITDNTSFDEYIERQNVEGKVFLVTLNEWKYDKPPKGFGKTAFYYDLDIAVKFQGETIATHNLKGKRIVKSIKLINEDYAWTYESIFDSLSVRNAFSGNYFPSNLEVAPPTTLETTPVNTVTVESKVAKPKNVQPTSERCTVDQILKMNKLGLDEVQIKAACSN